MKTVGILSNLHEKCGSADHGRYLAKELRHYYNVLLSDKGPELSGCDVVIINWHPARIKLTDEMVRGFQRLGSKVIVIYQNTLGVNTVERISSLDLADAVITHEPISRPTEVIPVGIWIVKGLAEKVEPMIGTAGFPFPWKQLEITAGVAKSLGVKYRLMAPYYDYDKEAEDLPGYIKGISDILGPLADIHNEWLPVEDVIRELSECAVNVFWFNSQGLGALQGQSGSVRIGLAARRPIIISRHRKFTTLFPYEDELYIADTVEQVREFAEGILQAPEKAKRPKRILSEMGWPAAGRKHAVLIERLTNGA